MIVDSKKKNIVLITNLYPGFVGQPRREITYAIHKIYKELTDRFSIKTFRIWNYFPIAFNILDAARLKRAHAFQEEVMIETIPVCRLPIRSFPYLYSCGMEKKKVSKKIISLCDADKSIPDVVICHMIEPSFEIARNVSMFFNRPLVVVLHNSDLNVLKSKKKVSEHICECDGIVFRSDKIKRIVSAYLRDEGKQYGAERQYVLYSGIDAGSVISDEKKIEKIENKNKKFVLVSNLDSKNKMVDTVIKAYIAMETTDTTLSIIGEGRLKNSLKKLAGFRPDIVFHGGLEHELVQSKLEESDVFVLVSKKETFGISYVEAMSKGCVVVGSKGEGIDGLLVNAENGFLCEPGDIADLTGVLRKCYSMTTDEKRGMIDKSIATARSLNQGMIADGYGDYLEKIISISSNKR